GIRDATVTGVQTCALPISCKPGPGEHVLLSVRCGRLDHLLRRTLFLPIGHVGKVRCDRGAVTDLHRRVGLLAGAHAVDEIGHVRSEERRVGEESELWEGGW